MVFHIVFYPRLSTHNYGMAQTNASLHLYSDQDGLDKETLLNMSIIGKGPGS